MSGVLDGICTAADVRNVPEDELSALAGEVRAEMLSAVSHTGGHLASSLGAVELTIALLRVFDPERDRVLWDVGHQTYAWKMLTGRRGRLNTLRSLDGLSGFCCPEETPCDAFVSGHAGNALAAAEGLAAARDLAGGDEQIVAVVGDASLANGESLEALNAVAALKGKVLLVINDNATSACPHSAATAAWLNPTFFASLGMRFLGPVDGHDAAAVERALRAARDEKGSVCALTAAMRDGTGLRSVVYAPFAALNPELCSPAACYDRGVEAPNLEFAAADEFVPGSGVTANAYSAMTGFLIVPFTGSYTFRLDNPNGGAVFIDADRLWAMNSWNNPAKMVGEIQLTAGVHAIEVHTRLEDAANRLKLYWSGAVSEELVPASQLLPADAPFSFDFAKDWKARFYGGDSLGAVWTNANGSVQIRAGILDAGNWRTNPKTVFYAHDCKRAFTLSAHVKDLKTGSGHFGLMARAANGNFVRFYCANTGTGYANYAMTALKSGDTAITTVKGASGDHRTDNMICDMQLVYDEQTREFIASYHNPSADGWVEFARWVNDGSIYGEFEVGLFVGGGYSGHDCGEVEFSDIVFKQVRGTFIFLK